ncbi:hypothetical protein Exig_2616 [Exiguobacterium sibiricum 255-15]|uniref:BIG2 domain-containing protein n=1 Tax=Exiguobacterium sibiricum (strain DSM 17290 / CCUG 55495 / CIP 109462 / JCM 13490 / 255-15) TaxID=262543 RepID=B1YMK5_EXIS2|nr:hypothetical protein [Exiguobacterium sibiricum]ACB62065.1 hypothetical protein Exig_2616 [Exiguobacterium sibiricum 255-15]
MKKMIAGVILISILYPNLSVSASVSLPTVAQINDDVIGQNSTIRGNTLYYADHAGTNLVDLETGTRLRTEDTGDTLLDVSTDESWMIAKEFWHTYFTIYDEFGEEVRTVDNLRYQNQVYRFNSGIKAKFLPNSSKLVIASDDHIFVYDIKTEKVLSARGISTDGTLKVSNDYIMIGDDSSIHVMNHALEMVTEILPQERIISYDVTRFNTLILNTYDGRIYQYKSPFTKSVLSSLKTYDEIDLDDSGVFLGTSKGILYDMQTAKRIYTNIEESRIVFNENSSKIVTLGDSVRVYDAKNLKKRIVSAKISTDFNSLIVRNETIPTFVAISKDGTKTKLTNQAVWRSDNPQVAYFSKGKLIGKSPGKVTIKGSYEGHTATLSLTVRKESKTANLKWLMSQKSILNQKGTFVNASHQLYDSYSKVKGTNGKIYYQEKVYTNGIFKGNVLYGTYRNKKTIDEILLPLSGEKRTDISEKQIIDVFGKPKKTYKYDPAVSSKVTRGTSILDQHQIKKISLYMVKKNNALEVIYDEKGYARYLHLFESTPGD